MTNLFNSLYQSICISVRIEFDDAYPVVDCYDLSPEWHLSWTVLLDSLEMKWKSTTNLQVVAPMSVEIANFLNPQLFEILSLYKALLHRWCIFQQVRQVGCSQHTFPP